MNMRVLDLEIKEELNDGFYKILIVSNNISCYISFSPSIKELRYLEDNELIQYLSNNEFQLRRLLHNKRPNTYYKGFQLRFALRDNKDVLAFNDRSNIVVLDKTNDTMESYVIDTPRHEIDEIFIDASFMEKYQKGGYAIIHKDLNKEYHLYKEKSESKSSSLLELEAAIKAMEILEATQSIRIITDSQYVRKGLTEWIMNWRLNDWKTANGTEVKNKECWIKFDDLTQGKYIEFEWVKGHSNHFENTMCDLYARQIARS